ncbi:hypothetical protein QQ008_18355 [Fulvivirgaceae bacterium BMA10]|uniref:Lipoprotein n=1 Tax=Splendidivirga corallicola TaxID=3051826 RepID=A0ABT8KV63_9BACT|nr:hypothetical protein [Fulvivirgaceae bacterium BMA10]
MRKICFGLVVLFLSACGSNGSKEQALLDSLDTLSIEAPEVSEEVISDIVQQIPSPLEISVLLKESGTKYNYSMLNSPDKASNYNNNFQKAINLGIYGTDLGYTNIYEQNQDAIGYLRSIRDLADGLSIGQFFDFETIRKLAVNSNNLDSLLLITTRNFNNINSYLQDQKRANLSILLLTGGWLEALNITCQVYSKSSGNEVLKEKIGEQKIILEQIMLLLSLYEQDTRIKAFSKELEPLKQVFDNIEITTTYAESTFEEVDGVLMIVDNSTSTINITDEHIADITRITQEIRNRLIN